VDKAIWYWTKELGFKVFLGLWYLQQTKTFFCKKVGPESGGGQHVAVTAESTMLDVCETLGASETKKASKPMQPTICSMNCTGAGFLV
jgi:hypothetical protein